MRQVRYFYFIFWNIIIHDIEYQIRYINIHLMFQICWTLLTSDVLFGLFLFLLWVKLFPYSLHFSLADTQKESQDDSLL